MYYGNGKKSEYHAYAVVFPYQWRNRNVHSQASSSNEYKYSLPQIVSVQAFPENTKGLFYK